MTPQPLLRRIDRYRASLAEHQVRHQSAPEQVVLAHLLGVEFLYLPLVENGDPVDMWLRHGCRFLR